MNVNPKQIKNNDLPLIVFSDCTSGIFSSLIKIWTKANYNHGMWMHKEGMFASQGNTYSETKVERYMKKNMRLKFYKIVGLTVVQRRLILASICNKLSLPWWRKMYDWIGIIGQTIRIKVLSTPGLDYCSEDVPRHLRKISPYIDNDFKDAILGVPIHGSPVDLNSYFKANNFFEVYGYWDSDANDSE